MSQKTEEQSGDRVAKAMSAAVYGKSGFPKIDEQYWDDDVPEDRGHYLMFMEEIREGQFGFKHIKQLFAVHIFWNADEDDPDFPVGLCVTWAKQRGTTLEIFKKQIEHNIKSSLFPVRYKFCSMGATQWAALECILPITHDVSS